MKARRGFVPTPLPNVPMMEMRIVATILTRARNNAASHLINAWSEGLTMYGTGSVGYELSAKAIKRAEASGKFPWLKLLTPQSSQEIVFTIHDVPFKFYRGDEEHKASLRHAQPSSFEASRGSVEQIELLEDAQSDPGVNRLIVTTTDRGFAAGVYYARVTLDRVQHEVTSIPVLMPSSVNAAFEIEALSIVHLPAETMKAKKPRRKKTDQDAASGDA